MQKSSDDVSDKVNTVSLFKICLKRGEILHGTDNVNVYGGLFKGLLRFICGELVTLQMSASAAYSSGPHRLSRAF